MNNNNNNHLNPIFDPKAQNIRLPCPSCAFPPKNDAHATDNSLRFALDGANDVVLSFRVSRDEQRLELDGETVYPLQFSSTSFAEQHPIYVSQIPAHASDVDVASNQASSTPLRVTSSALRIAPEGSVSSDDYSVVSLRYQIVGLEGQYVAVDEVAIQLLRTGDGELLIVRVDVVPDSAARTRPSGLTSKRPPKLQSCGVLPSRLCKLKTLIEAKINELKQSPHSLSRPCMSFRPGRPGRLSKHIAATPDLLNKEDDMRPLGHGRPHHMKPYFDRHDPHDHHSRHQSYFHAFARGVIAVLIPIFAGIAVGLSVSFLGLVVGRLIGYLWLVLVRRGRRGQKRVSQCSVDPEQMHKMIESGLLDGVVFDESLPAYEDAPMYEHAPSYEESEKGQR